MVFYFYSLVLNSCWHPTLQLQYRDLHFCFYVLSTVDRPRAKNVDKNNSYKCTSIGLANTYRESMKLRHWPLTSTLFYTHISTGFKATLLYISLNQRFGSKIIENRSNPDLSWKSEMSDPDPLSKLQIVKKSRPCLFVWGHKWIQNHIIIDFRRIVSDLCWYCSLFNKF